MTQNDRQPREGSHDLGGGRGETDSCSVFLLWRKEKCWVGASGLVVRPPPGPKWFTNRAGRTASNAQKEWWAVARMSTRPSGEREKDSSLFYPFGSRCPRGSLWKKEIDEGFLRPPRPRSQKRDRSSASENNGMHSFSRHLSWDRKKPLGIPMHPLQKNKYVVRKRNRVR